MTPNPSVNQTAPHSSDEYAALVHAAQDSGDWKPVVDWLARHPERAREFARFMDADDLTRRGLPPARASFSDLPGTVVDGYEIHEKLGSGGAGDVFRGYDPAL